MTLLGVPAQAQFSIGTSSTTAPASSESQMDMSLDDMIKSRRVTSRSSNTTRRRSAASRKPTAADKATGKARASRAAKINARRGIQRNAQGKPSAMEIEREVYRQTRMNTNNTSGQQKRRQSNKTGGKISQPRSRKDSAAQVKARKQQKTDQKKKAQKNSNNNNSTPPTWVAGSKRPPSKKAVNAAVNAMTNNGFKVPQGMQMVISFAPAPDSTPASNKKNTPKGKQKGINSSNKKRQNNTSGRKK